MSVFCKIFRLLCQSTLASIMRRVTTHKKETSSEKTSFKAIQGFASASNLSTFTSSFDVSSGRSEGEDKKSQIEFPCGDQSGISGGVFAVPRSEPISIPRRPVDPTERFLLRNWAMEMELERLKIREKMSAENDVWHSF